ncbi:MAG: EAL domain-containing protein [Acidisphaera sp.]|nr:EAL domain-containing protein [Acidisphaera sp.]
MKALICRSGGRPSAARIPQHYHEGERLAGAVTGLAALASIIIALAFPAAYWLSAHNRLMGVLEVRARIYADQVTNDASESPELWNAFFGDGGVDLTGLEIAAPDDDLAAAHPPERRRILTANGHALLDINPKHPVLWPTESSRIAVVQNGNRLGDVEIVRSVRPELLTTLAIAAGSFSLGLMLLLVLRVVPLRLMRRALDRAAFLSAHDLLTGLPNRALLADRLEQALSAARRSDLKVAMLCLDLDHFKEVNDTLGHAAGDALLQAVAARLHGCLRDTDTLARTGGDEFAIIQPAIRHPRDAETVAKRLLDSMRGPVTLDGNQVFVGVSIGIAINEDGADAGELTKQADVALYQAKAAGRSGFCFFAPEMNFGLQHRRALENDLRSTIDQGALAVHYQPQIDVASGKIVGAEALMRWTRPGHGPVPPSQFIPIAEETGLIVPMGAWLLGKACSDAAGWPASMQVAVNVSPVQFRFNGFVDVVRGALAQSGLDPRRLELEVTEGILLNDTQETLLILAELRGLGVRLAMDDFGTGYASLGYLQKFRFDKIKIDRSFVQNLGVDPNAGAIVRAVVGLSDALGMATNAEGVESEDQLDMLRAHGCREIQGFLYWPPMPVEALRDVLHAQREATLSSGDVEAAV